MRQPLIVGLVVLLIGGMMITASAQTPLPTESPDDELTIRIWWPDEIYPFENEDALDELNDLIAEFNRSTPQYNVTVRVKPHQGSGSIINTLEAAHPIAPNALPDMVLLSRVDMIQAARSGLIRQLEDWVPDTLRLDLLPNVINLGTLDNILYGLPYALNLYHMTYHPPEGEDVPEEVAVDFQSILATEYPFLMPGAPIEQGVANKTVLAQYLSAGGRLVDDAEIAILDQEPLLDVLAFYEEAVQNGVLSAEVLDYGTPQDYWEDYLASDMPLAMTDSTLYLQDASAQHQILPIPNIDGRNLVILDGWMWVLTTTNPDQQMGVLQFVEWIMSAETHADFTQTFGILPSRRRALRIWSDTAYVAQIEVWMRDSILLPIASPNRLAAELIQQAWSEVLNGMTHQEAAENALNALSANN